MYNFTDISELSCLADAIEFDINTSSLWNNYKLECALIDITDFDYLTEAEDAKPANNTKSTKKTNAFVEFIDNAIKSINAFFSKIFNKLAEVVGGKDSRMSIEDYMKSDTGKYRFQSDLDKIVADSEKRILESRKFVQLIAKGGKYDPQEVAEVIDRMANIVDDSAGDVIKTGVQLSGWFSKNKHLKASITSALEEMKAAAKTCYDPKRKSDIAGIANGLIKLGGNLMTVGSKVTDTYMKTSAEKFKKA